MEPGLTTYYQLHDAAGNIKVSEHPSTPEQAFAAGEATGQMALAGWRPLGVVNTESGIAVFDYVDQTRVETHFLDDGSVLGFLIDPQGGVENL